MSTFSQRHGYQELRSIVQREDLDHETRLLIWNVVAVLREVFREPSYPDGTESTVLSAIWTWDLKEARDERPSDDAVWRRLKEIIQGGDWWAVFDVIEALADSLDRYKTPTTEHMIEVFVEALNGTLEQCLVGYRLIENKIVPIDSAVETSAVVDALESTNTFEGARHHLNRAIELLADRQSPDYPNSIKESISAVESVCRKVTGEGTLGAALKKLATAGVTIHPALESAWSKMYGWTSDADGIRHGGIDAAVVDQSLARYMLATCAAFVSYVIESARKAGLV